VIILRCLPVLVIAVALLFVPPAATIAGATNVYLSSKIGFLSGEDKAMDTDGMETFGAWGFCGWPLGRHVSVGGGMGYEYFPHGGFALPFFFRVKGPIRSGLFSQYIYVDGGYSFSRRARYESQACDGYMPEWYKYSTNGFTWGAGLGGDIATSENVTVFLEAGYKGLFWGESDRSDYFHAGAGFTFSFEK
jgi:hypothetical protein